MREWKEYDVMSQGSLFYETNGKNVGKICKTFSVKIYITKYPKDHLIVLFDNLN